MPRLRRSLFSALSRQSVTFRICPLRGGLGMDAAALRREQEARGHRRSRSTGHRARSRSAGHRGGSRDH